MLDTSVVLHCFPPGGDPPAGERQTVFMGHPRHTLAEVRFQQAQQSYMQDKANLQAKKPKVAALLSFCSRCEECCA